MKKTPAKDTIGQRFGRLVVTGFERVNAVTFLLCVCDCGNEARIRYQGIRSGTKSCGCLHREGLIKRSTRHGMYSLPERSIWSAMKQRCKNKNDKFFSHYGGRGIEVCKEWESFEAFFRDMGPRPSAEHSLDRIDNDKGYFKENCRWATAKEQGNNKRTCRFIEHDGMKLTAKQWSERNGINYSSIMNRTKKLGWDASKAVSVPARKKKP